MTTNADTDPATAQQHAIEAPGKARETRQDYRELMLNDIPLLDVRAPVEFVKGAFPMSVNLPLMTDEERHLTGIRYKESGQQSAIELGAELVGPELRKERVEQWRQFVQQHPDAVLYCFRGGLRSRITQHWLHEAGVDLPLVEGGYKALRTFLINTLKELCESLDFTLIGGRTGNGKTLLIHALGRTVDLEALAHHRGSSFGGMAQEQPSNIDFENAVAIALMKLEHSGAQRVFLEDEAHLIGRVCLPETLRDTMQQAPIVILECDMQTRIQHCFDDYVPDLLKRYQDRLGEQQGFAAFREHHKGSLSRIQKRFGGKNYQESLSQLEAALDRHENHGDTDGYAAFIERLLKDYYDPMYDYQLSKKQHRVIFKGTFHDIVSWANAV